MPQGKDEGIVRLEGAGVNLKMETVSTDIRNVPLLTTLEMSPFS